MRSAGHRVCPAKILPSWQLVAACTTRRLASAHSFPNRDPRCASLAQVYPCRLSVLVLPAQQVLEAATLVDCARRLCAVYGAPWHITFKLQVSGCFCKLHPGSCFAGCARAPLPAFTCTSL